VADAVDTELEQPEIQTDVEDTQVDSKKKGLIVKNGRVYGTIKTNRS